MQNKNLKVRSTKIHIKLILISFTLLSLLIFRGCKKQTNKWKGEIEYKNGIKIIKNPELPLFGKIEFDLEEDLSIGREDDENYLFFQVRDISLDSRKNIYILDTKNHRIQKFNSNGRYLQTIGRRGQGPSEFENPINLFLDNKDDIYVSDGREIEIFNKYGEFKKHVPLEVDIMNFSITSEGDILARMNPSKERKEAIVKINAREKTIKYLTKYSNPAYAFRKGSKKGSFLIFTASHSYTPHICFSPINKDSYIYGFPSKYEFYIADNEGNVQLKIQKDEKIYPITDKEKNFIIKNIEENISNTGKKWPEGVLEEACQFPSHRPYFRKIYMDGEQRLYVWRVESIFKNNNTHEFDLFSKEGYYLYQVIIPVLPEIIQNNFIYDIDENINTGEIRVRRFKIKNFNFIKKAFDSKTFIK